VPEFIYDNKLFGARSGNQGIEPSTFEHGYRGSPNRIIKRDYLIVQITKMSKRYMNLDSFSTVLGLGLFLMFIMGCKKFVEIPPPDSQLVATSVFNNSAAATAAQLSIYIQMEYSESYNMSQNLGMQSDELTSYSTQLTQMQLYTNALTSASDDGNWGHAYHYIYQANAIIAALQNNGSIIPSINQQLTGESKFLRAFWHFYLTNMYGDIPVVLTTDYTSNSRIARTPQTEVYSQIIKDLSDAAQLLSSNYLDASDTTITTERIRPTKWAAYAMLARAYLYEGRYDSAKAAAALVIGNNDLYQLCSNLSPSMGPQSVFLANSSETIWQLSIPLPAQYNTLDAMGFVLTGAPATGTYRCSTISPQLLSSFEPLDLRKTNWIGIYKTGDSPVVNYYFPYKYQNITGSVTEYVMVLRLAEQYLIRAEAEAQMNDLTDAATDLNVIRNRAGLSNISDSIAISQPALIAAILHERQVELFTEWGHRWFDLRRTGNLDSLMGGPSGVCQTKGGSWVSTDQLYPIPLSDIQTDHNLTQNAGY
jgi:starch-binding outer membrane protein, SusD/RagB family